MNIQAFLAAAPRGTAASIARALGVHPVMVSQWAAGKQIATEQCPQIERATAGAVTVEEQRPDVRWHRVADAEWPHPDGRPLIDVARPVPADQPTETANVQ